MYGIGFVECWVGGLRMRVEGIGYWVLGIYMDKERGARGGKGRSWAERGELGWVGRSVLYSAVVYFTYLYT